MSAFDTLRGWRTRMVRFITNWQTNRPGANVGFRYLFSLVLPIDIELENTLQGINAWAPGSPNATLTALPLIGNSRGLIQGEAETDAHFASRLIAWRAITKEMGKSERLALEIQNYLENTPLVRVVERLYSDSGAPRAFYVTANTDGSTTTQTANWDWDSVGGWTGSAADGTNAGSVTRTWWSDFWIVVYPCEWPVTGTALSALAPIWGRTDIGLGHAVPVVARDAIVRIVAQWKGLHTFCRAIIFSYDATLFDPANPSASGDPNGTWGPCFNRTGEADGRVRYWEPTFG
jgi:hypothetical protein